MTPGAQTTLGRFFCALQAVRRLLRGEDAALLHCLEGLGIPCKLMRVWKVGRPRKLWV